MNDFLRSTALRRVINASGTETVHGASRALPEVVEAMAAVLPNWVEIAELQQLASRTIAEATGAEAGMITGCSAAGICVSVAAAMAGRDLGRAEMLPEVTGLKSRVVMLKGHAISFGGLVTQMIRIPGATPVEVGSSNSSAVYQLEQALADDVAAAVYVLSHHTVQSGMIDLATFCQVCRRHGVPVIVDAAAEYDWQGYLSDGADAVIFSAQKAPAGPTAGVIAGRADFIHACYVQEFGVGRPMKAGKESIAGAIAALLAWRDTDWAEQRQGEQARLSRAEELLRDIPGFSFSRMPDPTGNPFERLAIRIDPAAAGMTAAQLGDALTRGPVKICLRVTMADRGILLLDARRVTEEELAIIAEAIRTVLADPGSAALDGPTRGDRNHALIGAWGKGAAKTTEAESAR